MNRSSHFQEIGGTKNPVEKSNIKDKAYVVLNELGTGQVSKTFCATLSIHTYACKDQLIYQAFRITLFNRQSSIMFLNAGNYIQSVLGGTGNASSLNLDRIMTVFEVRMLFHCVNMVTSAIAAETLSLNLNYRSGNIIGLAVHILCSLRTQLMQRFSNKAFSSQLLRYMWYNDTTGCYESLRREDRFSPLSHRESLTPFVLRIRSGAGFNDTTVRRNPETDHAMPHLSFVLLFKLKHILCNNFI